MIDFTLAVENLYDNPCSPSAIDLFEQTHEAMIAEAIRDRQMIETNPLQSA
jgi:hypothetical protein